MTDGAELVLVVATALGCALAGGVFFAFSTFVMPALARLDAPQGISAMQSVNVAAIVPSFMGALFGTAAACVGVAALAAARWEETAAPWLLAGALVYVAGAIGTTVAFNVPRNESLARLAPDGVGAAESWRRYVREWTAANHIRAAAALAAAALLVTGLLVS